MSAGIVAQPLAAERPGRRPQLTDFRLRFAGAGEQALGSPADLHRLSVTRPREFWRTFLDWADLAWEGPPEPVCTGDDVETAAFFPGVRLNYAENLLRPLCGVDDGRPALTGVRGDGVVVRYSRGELRDLVARTARALAALGVGRGERVAAVAPNRPATAVAALAVAALGAPLATAMPAMGPRALLGRFTPLRPGTLLVHRTGGADDVLGALLAELPSVRRVVLLDDLPLPAAGGVSVTRLADLVAALPDDASPPSWPRVPFDHPLWVMASSGTTGPPKGIVHGTGGCLLEHVKEHRLHLDLSSADTLYFHTTTAWMMWHWQLSALAVGAHVVLYDGVVDGPETLWELVAAHGVTVFGTSPAYLQLCEDEGYRPRDAVDLGPLRAVLSTGSVLHDWQFDWVADAVGHLPLQSISGGTDLMGCFVLGHPEAPVRRGRCQSLSLGLDVVALDEDGSPVLGQVGELVCRQPFPSRPVGFLDDPDGARFHEAYFSQHPGVWTHGDLIEIDADGSARMHGRSDGVLNVDGIRIGPAEIRSILHRVPEVAESMALEQRHPTAPGRTRLVLLVVLRPGLTLDDALVRRIRSVLAREGSAAHVPSVVLAVSGLPTTHSGKLSERAARDTLDGVPPRNTGALRNPEVLAELAAAAAAHAPSPLPEPSPVAEHDLGAVVARAFRDVLGEDVPPDVGFSDAGGTSRQSMTLLRRLRLETGRSISMEEFLADPTVRGVTGALASPSGEPAALPVLRAGDVALPPLHLVHGAYGDVDSYTYLVGHIRTPRPVVGLSGRVLGPGGETCSIPEIARAHVARLVAERPTGPVLLAGYSFGGMVALHMAQLLTGMGREVAFLGLVDVLPPYGSLTRGQQLMRKAAGAAAMLVPGMSNRTLAQALAGARGLSRPAADERALADAESAYNDYRPAPYAGPVTYFRARRRVPVFTELLYTWRRLVPQLRVVDVPGAHHDMLGQRHAPGLGAALSASLPRSA
ncbi:acetoacetate--CoA ligase [Modestobacter marinus]|uniref:acetoacetate--CoA ligase n=1 Tax=Modestobacter marinus TaxID=477641 RepID=UPI001C965884|nr:acetoacetate--CoA ligase [Modestobacter marinus]